MKTVDFWCKCALCAEMRELAHRMYDLCLDKQCAVAANAAGIVMATAAANLPHAAEEILSDACDLARQCVALVLNGDQDKQSR